MIRFTKQKYIIDCWKFVNYYSISPYMSSNLSYNRLMTSSSTNQDTEKPIIGTNYISAAFIPRITYYSDLLCGMQNRRIATYFPSEKGLNSVVDPDDQI